jgi:lipid-A-disaccharide synthase
MVILPNLLLNESIVPELLQESCTPEALADAVIPRLMDTPDRRRQLEAFKKLDKIMKIEGDPPSVRAAKVILAAASKL